MSSSSSLLYTLVSPLDSGFSVVHPISNLTDLKRRSRCAAIALDIYIRQYQVAETPQESAEEIQTYARYRSLSCLAGLLKPDIVEGAMLKFPEFNVSYKHEKIGPKFPSIVETPSSPKIRDSYMHPQFMSDVMKPLQIEQLMDQEVVNLSSGELQRVALCLCLGKILFYNALLLV
ncbi:hypothetical protein Syun_012159 [Stephania yunnanensis]|uniref:ABC transporter domain-containing protein n=1 Tax=Stephania yunnanensis TaxID=152371 RepID=A0AAP0JZQ9_9MAGN